jgi:FMN phosphatase YigB (HAD superfamily)
MINPPFDRVETWIFDLDNTLYPPDDRLFRQIEARISGYLQRELGVGAAEADTLLLARPWHHAGGPDDPLPDRPGPVPARSA